jgi:hypothetical protein
MGDTKAQIVNRALYDPEGGLRRMAGEGVMYAKLEVTERLNNNEVPDLTAYAQACFFRDLVFSIQPKSGDSWHDALKMVRIIAFKRSQELTSPDRKTNAYGQAAALAEMAAIHLFLNRTRSLV